MRDYNNKIESMVVKHFGGGRNKRRSDASLAFACAMKIGRKLDPEEFAELFESIITQDAVEYFHKGFRQIDIFNTPSMDSLMYNIISLFGEDDWDNFNAFMAELIEFNQSRS